MRSAAGSSGLALGPRLALDVGGVLVGAGAGFAADEGAGVVFFGAVSDVVGEAFQERGMALLGAQRFRRALGQGAGGGFFGAADGHLVQRVLAEQRLGAIGAGAHVVERGFGEVG